jgi:tRNA modification GTPase
LARREVAIVSSHAGTTRDILEVHLDLDGYPVTLLDTAGIRHSDEPVEQEGVRRARERAAAADLVLWVIDASAGGRANDDTGGVSKHEAVWLIENKMDLAGESPRGGYKGSPVNNECKFSYYISASTGDGMGALEAALGAYASEYFSGGDSGIVTRARHRRALEETEGALARALVEAKTAGREELIAEELRAAAITLGRLTGRVDVEDILDVIFRDFCIGK